jgi:hypothetical protein
MKQPALHVRALVALAVLAASCAFIVGAAAGSTGPLSVTTSAPADGATVSGDVTWQANVSNGTPASVDFLVDGTLVWTSYASPYMFRNGPGLLPTKKLADGSHELSVIAHGGQGSSKSTVTVTVLNDAPAVLPSATAPPALSGTAQPGQVLTTSQGSWNGTAPMSFAYNWLRCNSSGSSCKTIHGATGQGQTYSVRSTDVGATLRALVVASNTAGVSLAQSAPSALVASSPPPPPPPPASSIYWGAYIEGVNTYNYLYGGTWSNAPWCDPGTQCPLPRFQQNAAKQVSIEHWGMCWGCSFDTGIANLVVSRGDIPAIDWSNGSVPDANVASGMYDSYLTAQAQAAKAFGHPLFILFDEEMNGTWYPYSPGQNGNTAAGFVAMWRHVHDVFQAVGATNVTWVWCPNIDPGGIFTPFSQIYPGDAYVDWTGLNGYNWGGSEWTSFSSVFAQSYTGLLQVAPSKPIMIGEVASEETGGSKSAWITDALLTQLPQNFPRIKALLWFNWRIYEKNAWHNWEIESSTASRQAFATAINSSYYAAGGSFGNLPLLTKIQPLP